MQKGWSRAKYLRFKKKHPNTPVPLLLLTTISAKHGISCPSWAIVQSEGFKRNLEAMERIFEKSQQLRRLNARKPD